jgi:cytochrome c-type biogenesis protein CcmH
MNFWIIAVVLFFVSAAAFAWPLFAGNGKDRITSILVLLVVPIAGLSLYQVVGTPEAIGNPAVQPQQADHAQQPHNMSGAGDIDALLQQLNQRLAEDPNNPDGWLILGRTLKTQQRFVEAEAALDKANSLIPNTPMIMVELAEARLFASGTPVITDDIKQLLEAALAIDPQQQKGLWLLGIAAAEEGDNAGAISYWETLLAQLEPGSPSAQRVSEQIAQITGSPVETMPAPAQTPADVEMTAEDLLAGPTTIAETGIPVLVTIADEFAGTVPGNAPLFVFVHPAGGAGMPLAVKRLAAQGLPMSLTFTDADLLQPGNSLQNFEQLDVSARIAFGGTVNATSGDIQAEKVTVDTKAIQTISLHLDKRIP